MRWLALLRPHQWSKNLLVFVSALVGHQYTQQGVIADTLLCFLAFCLAASAGYIVNDLLDLADDRGHPRKKLRPLAAGEISTAAAMAAALALLATGLYTAWLVNTWVLATVACYLLTTSLYSLWLKRKLLLDIIVLAGLYTIRIIGGVAVVGLAPSFWLLAFAMFIFSSLATLKRYVELRERSSESMESHSLRAYRTEDQPILLAFGVASGLLAVLVLAFYMDSAQVQSLYRTTVPLWFLCPLIMYWVGRVWMLASRSLVDEDPIAFALRDKTSYLVAAAAIVLLGLAK